MSESKSNTMQAEQASNVAVLDASSAEDLQGRVRDAHRCYPSGVTVVTTSLDGQPYGLAVNAFSSVSLDPPQVLVCVNTSSKTHAHLHQGTHLGVNFLAHDQVAVASVFAKSGGDKFAGLSWHASASGVPMLDGVSASFEIEIEQRIPSGTHTIFLGKVLDVEVAGHAPLVYFDGKFFDGSKLNGL